MTGAAPSLRAGVPTPTTAGGSGRRAAAPTLVLASRRVGRPLTSCAMLTSLA
jgi:hypothetical protein